MRLWHRRLGLFLLIWVFFVALTGIGLNHSEDFGLDKIPLSAEILQSVYEIEPPPIESYFISGHWISLVGKQQLYLDRNEIGFCNDLRGMATGSGNLFVACMDSVYVLNDGGEIIEQLTGRFGLPVPINRLGDCNGHPCLESDGQTYALDTDTFEWKSTAGQNIQLLGESDVPQGLGGYLRSRNTPPDFHLERLIRDFHSGLFFGLGPWLMDIFAVALLVLSMIGIATWWLLRGGKQ